MTYFAPYGTPQQVRDSAVECWEKIRLELIATDGSRDEDGDINKSAREDGYRIRGILFNQYGYVDDDTMSDSLPFVASPLAQYKLLSTAILIETLEDLALQHTKLPQEDDMTKSSQLFDSEMRIIAVGTEAARGLPKMGFPEPIIAKADDDIVTILTSAATLMDSWEMTYGQLSALQVLYCKALAGTKQPLRQPMDGSFSHWFYGVVSPGMTPESFHVKHVPPKARTVGFRLKMILCRYIMFPLLRKMEIAKTVDDAGRLLAAALLGRKEFGYPSGCFVGAKSGTGGPLCEQSILEGGKQLADPELQALTYQVVQKFINNEK